MGKLIVIEGLDGSGKCTQTQILFDRLLSSNTYVRKISFPNYDCPASEPVKMYLAGKFGDKPDDVNAYAASVLYAVDRFASFKADWSPFYNNGGIVLADRYTTSNAIHQCSKLPREEWDDYLTWLFETEYDRIAIPKPDLVIYLSVDPSISQTLLTKRYNGNELKKDIHERDTEYLERSREAAKYCAHKCKWETINCCVDGEMLPIEEISLQVFNLAINVM